MRVSLPGVNVACPFQEGARICQCHTRDGRESGLKPGGDRSNGAARLITRYSVLCVQLSGSVNMAKSKGLPGLRGTDHIGITVPDFDEAVDFFEKVLGLEPFYQMGPFGSEDDDFMADMLNVHPRAVIRRVKQFRCGFNTNIELFEYESPDQRREMPKNSDWGGHHIALYVDDIEAGMAHLREHKVRLMPGGGGPTIKDGPEAGLRSCYFLTPWGMQMELISYPEGKGYERDTDRRLWDPRSEG